MLTCKHMHCNLWRCEENAASVLQQCCSGAELARQKLKASLEARGAWLRTSLSPCMKRIFPHSTQCCSMVMLCLKVLWLFTQKLWSPNHKRMKGKLLYICKLKEKKPTLKLFCLTEGFSLNISSHKKISKSSFCYWKHHFTGGYTVWPTSPCFQSIVSWHFFSSAKPAIIMNFWRANFLHRSIWLCLLQEDGIYNCIYFCLPDHHGDRQHILTHFVSFIL